MAVYYAHYVWLPPQKFLNFRWLPQGRGTRTQRSEVSGQGTEDGGRSCHRSTAAIAFLSNNGIPTRQI